MTSPDASAAGAPAPYGPAPDGERVVYRGVTLIDGTGAAARPGTSVVTDGPTIALVAPDDRVPGDLLVGAETVDLTGHTMTPGLIDTHQHLATPPDRARAEALLSRQLYSGVTTIRDMADDLRQIADLARATLVGELPGPEIAYAALMAGPSFFDDPRTWQVSKGATPGAVPWMQAIEEATDLAIAAAMARGTGAAAVKIYADLPGELVARVTDAAHSQGLHVWAHATVFPAAPADVVAAGVDVVSHASYLLYHLLESVPSTFKEHRAQAGRSNRLLAEADLDGLTPLLDAMRQHGTVLDATASMAVHPEHGSRGDDAALLVPLVREVLARSRAAGVDVSTGTDYENELEDPFPSLYREIAFLVRDAGFPALEVLRSATLVGARSLGQEAIMGSVEAGKLANLAVFARSPVDDVADLETIALTVKRGRRFSRSEWDRSGAASRGAGAPDESLERT